MKAVISRHDGLNTLSSILVLWFQSYFVQFDGIPVIHYWLILFHVGHQDLPKCSLRILTLWNEKRNFIVSRFQKKNYSSEVGIQKGIPKKHSRKRSFLFYDDSEIIFWADFHMPQLEYEKICIIWRKHDFSIEINGFGP